MFINIKKLKPIGAGAIVDTAHFVDKHTSNPESPEFWKTFYVIGTAGKYLRVVPLSGYSQKETKEYGHRNLGMLRNIVRKSKKKIVPFLVENTIFDRASVTYGNPASFLVNHDEDWAERRGEWVESCLRDINTKFCLIGTDHEFIR